MKQIVPGIWQWSWFSDEKQLDFNGHLLEIGDHRVIVDPPPMTGDALETIRRRGQVDYIVITNRDHTRESASLQKELGCRILAPQADSSEIPFAVDKTYGDGELLPGGIWAIHLADQKSPGESALFLQRGGGILILGDALIGKPPGQVAMLPPEKYTDASKARQGLQRLLKYDFDTLLVGDGASIITGAKPIVQQAMHA